MATLNINTFATTVANQVSAIQTQVSSLVSFSTGSILRATSNANAAIGMWLQGQALYVMSLSRFATSYGTDADTWGLDWGFFRASASNATGYVTFSRFTATATAFIPVGTLVMTADKTQSFAVVADATNPAWNAIANGYNLAAGITGVTVLCRSVNAASAANVGAGLISNLGSGISYVDYVSNALQFVGGTDAESDSSYKGRFPAYLQSLARATPAAVKNAMQTLQSGAQANLIEGFTYGGIAQPGYVTIIYDDGTGAPSTAFINAGAAAANNYRAAGIQTAVFAPTIITVNVSFTLTTGNLSSTAHTAAVVTAQTAVLNFIDSLLDGATLEYSELYQVIWNSGPGIITDVTNLLVNGGTADLVSGTVYDVYKAGSVVGT